MNLFLMGLNHHTAPVNVRERLAVTPSHLPDLLRALRAAPGVGEVGVVSTCNRFEMYAVVDDASARPTAIAETLAEVRGLDSCECACHLTTRVGADAARHLFRVAAGLDSLLVGEHQILGQVKDAFQAAQEAGTIGALLSALFRQALTAGKRARSETEIGQGARSLGQVAVALARETLGDLTDRTALLVGVGKINKLAGRALVESGLRWLLVANRTFERAVEVAQSLGGRAVHFDALAQGLADSDLVIVATGAPHIVLHESDLRAAMMRRVDRPLVVIDLAVPRNVDPAARALANVRLCDIDDLSAVVAAHHPVAAQALAAAEEIVAQETRAFLTWQREREVAPRMVALRAQAEAIRQAEVTKTLERLDLAPEQRRAIDALATALTNKLLYAAAHAIKS
ncbi:MAG: glutamyl-tRNA reductase [Chloroflexota bacterium]